MTARELLPQLVTYAAIAVFYLLAVPSLSASWKAKKKDST
jgi:hypothetical protein